MPKSFDTAPSFRIALLLSFAGVALLLGGAWQRSLQALDLLAEDNRQVMLDAMRIYEQTRLLAERTTEQERLVRQWLALAEQLREMGPASLGETLSDWRRVADSLNRQLQDVRPARGKPPSPVFDNFRRLAELNATLAGMVKLHVMARGDTLQQELRQQRQRLLWLGAGALALSLSLAAGLGWWLSASLGQLAAAIDRLGANQLTAAIRVGGPRDMRRFGVHLDWLRQRLAALESAKRQFLRQVSHELKTPLAALREGIALLDEGVAGRLDAQQKEIIVLLRQSALILQQRIEGLLQYNATLHVTAQSKLERLDLAAILRAVAEEQRLQWQTRRIRLELPSGAFWLQADVEHMRMIFGNLLTNAIRYTPKDGAIAFTLRRENKGGAPGATRAIIDCVDSGCGVATADREKIFMPFYQGRAPAADAEAASGVAVAGSGIGLSIVRDLVTARGGEVSLMPSDKGAHFRIVLPDAA